MVSLQGMGPESKVYIFPSSRKFYTDELPVLEKKALKEQENVGKGPSMKQRVQEVAEKQKYWMQRKADLALRKAEAEEKKKRLGGVGMKYTAIAMSNRE